MNATAADRVQFSGSPVFPAIVIASIDAYGATGTMLSTAAGRLSYVFGLQGPAVALDTACSSSLVAIQLACRSILDFESGDPDRLRAIGRMGGISYVRTGDRFELLRPK